VCDVRSYASPYSTHPRAFGIFDQNSVAAGRVLLGAHFREYLCDLDLQITPIRPPNDNAPPARSNCAARCARVASTERNDGSSRLRCMDIVVERAREELQFAEAELAVLKQEQMLRELLRCGEPTVEATARLRQFREAVERLASRKREERSAESDSGARRDDAA
jgi:hypothetical protein